MANTLGTPPNLAVASAPRGRLCKLATPVIWAVDTAVNTATIGLSYSTTIAGENGTPPYTFSLSGSLPTGLALNGSTGVISGTPSATGNFTFTIGVTDAVGNSASQAFTITVASVGGGNYGFIG